MKKLVLLTCIVISITAFGQPSFVVLRKHNQTIKTYFTASYIVLQLSNKQWIQGRIRKVKEDSLFIDQMVIRQVGNYFGLPSIDTVRLGLFKIPVHEIYALPKQANGINIISNGVLLQAAGAGYIALNIINGIGKSEPIFKGQNGTNLGIAAGVFSVGELLHLTYKDTYILGKKYMLYTSNNILVK